LRWCWTRRIGRSTFVGDWRPSFWRQSPSEDALSEEQRDRHRRGSTELAEVRRRSQSPQARHEARGTRRERCATSGKGGTGEMGGSIVSGRSQRVTFAVRRSEILELRTSNPRVSLVPPVPLVSLGYPAGWLLRDLVDRDAGSRGLPLLNQPLCPCNLGGF